MQEQAWLVNLMRVQHISESGAGGPLRGIGTRGQGVSSAPWPARQGGLVWARPLGRSLILDEARAVDGHCLF